MSTSTGRWRRAAPVAVLVLAVVAIGWVARPPRSGGEPLDPRSTEPLGARALVLLLERFGADVTVGGPPRTGSVALLLGDRLNDRDRTALVRWVEGGGTLVVADPLSSFAPPIGRDSSGLLSPATSADRLVEPRCSLSVLATVGAVDLSGAAPLRAPSGAVGCFPVPGGSYLVARTQGTGAVVALGGAGPLVNANLAEADNAVLAVSLLASDSSASVVVIGPSTAGGGTRGLRDLVSRRVKDGLWQLLVAFGLFALWRARRLGRPVVEAQPVQIAGSELVVAVGALLQQGRRRAAAGAMLRAAVRTVLGERVGVPGEHDPERLAAAVSRYTDRDAAAVQAILSGPEPVDDAALVALARDVESLRNEVTNA